MKNTVCGIQVPYSKAEIVLKILRKHQIVNLDLEFIREEESITIPTLVKKDELEKIIKAASLDFNFKIEKFLFNEKDINPKNLFEAIKNKIPEELYEYIPKAYDIIGDIVIIDIPEELMSFKFEFGKALLSLFPSINSVYRKASAVSGELRIRDIEFLSGEEKCDTIHTEHGVKIAVNVCKTYFSPRLGHEHSRISGLCSKDEIIVDLFTGVGPFPLHIAKDVGAIIHAVDINREALKCLEKSIDMNKLKGLIIPTNGDCRLVANTLPKADRIIMNLPGKAQEYLDVACKIAKPNSILYFYQFVSDSNPLEEMKSILIEKLSAQEWQIKEIISFMKIRESAPREIHACLEVSIVPQQ